MRIHFIQHEPFEAPGSLTVWAEAVAGNRVSFTKVWLNQDYPPIDAVDAVVILGGSMSAYDDALYAWMPKEKQWIKQAIDQKKKVLGICLGAQLLASVLGAKVFPGRYKEIGWFEVAKTDHAKTKNWLRYFPDTFITMHWHGDTFDLPENTERLFSSEATYNQGFMYKSHVMALQFHPEMTKDTILGMYDADEAPPEDVYVQSKAAVLGKTSFSEWNNHALALALTEWISIPN